MILESIIIPRQSCHQKKCVKFAHRSEQDAAKEIALASCYLKAQQFGAIETASQTVNYDIVKVNSVGLNFIFNLTRANYVSVCASSGCDPVTDQLVNLPRNMMKFWIRRKQRTFVLLTSFIYLNPRNIFSQLNKYIISKFFLFCLFIWAG